MIAILAKYFYWHYFEQSRIILLGWKNFLKFNLNFFSVPTLLKSFLAPWRRYEDSFGRGFDLQKALEVITFNLLSRIIGIIMRSILILTGLLMEFVYFFGGITIFIIWLIIPFLIILGLWTGFRLLF